MDSMPVDRGVAHPRESRPPAANQSVSLHEAFPVWCKVAALSFGGPAGQIAVMHRLLVEEKRWVSENRFLHALNYCMLLPGPEAQQLATYVGWLLHRSIGGLIAGTLFVLPGFLSILALSVLYARYQELGFVEALFFGLKPAVMAMVADALFRLGRKALRNGALAGIAALAFVAIFFFQVPFPLIVVFAGLLGFIGGRTMPEAFAPAARRQAEDRSSPASEGGANPLANYPVFERESAAESVAINDDTRAERPSAARTVRVAGLWLAIWLVPLLALRAWLGASHIFVVQGVFFSTAAMVTFGGAYAVLAFIAQQAVDVHGWLQPGEMLDGLGMAETTPGPLIQVVQFVGFMGAYRNPGALDPLLAGLLASILVTWVTFTPCFLWIFTGAPYIEYLRGNRALTTALTGITAAIVGVILNLTVWFSLHTLFRNVDEVHRYGARLLVPQWGSLDVASAAVAIGAFVAIFRFKVGILSTLAASVLAGLLLELFM